MTDPAPARGRKDRLRAIKAAVAGTFLLLLTSGCIDIDALITIREDGSGTVAINGLVDEETIGRMRAAARIEDEIRANSAGPLPPAGDIFTRLILSPDEKRIREEFSRYKDLGITLQEVKVRAHGAQREVRITAAMRDARKAVESDFFAAYGFALSKAGSNRWEVIIGRKPGQVSEPVPALPSGQLAPAEATLKTLKVRVALIPPGRIVETDADESSPTNAVWLISFEKDPQILTTLQNRKLRAVFECSTLPF